MSGSRDGAVRDLASAAGERLTCLRGARHGSHPRAGHHQANRPSMRVDRQSISPAVQRRQVSASCVSESACSVRSAPQPLLPDGAGLRSHRGSRPRERLALDGYSGRRSRDLRGSSTESNTRRPGLHEIVDDHGDEHRSQKHDGERGEAVPSSSVASSLRLLLHLAVLLPGIVSSIVDRGRQQPQVWARAPSRASARAREQQRSRRTSRGRPPPAVSMRSRGRCRGCR